MVMSKRTEWIRAMLANNSTQHSGDELDLLGRVESLESIILTQSEGGLLDKNSEELIATAMETLVENGERIDFVESTYAETVVEINEQIASLYKHVRVLAEFMERCSPFLKGMEEAFSSNDLGEDIDTEGGE